MKDTCYGSCKCSSAVLVSFSSYVDLEVAVLKMSYYDFFLVLSNRLNASNIKRFCLRNKCECTVYIIILIYYM